MSDFIHAREFLNQGNSVILNCDTQCNFLLMDDNNFNAYRSGRQYNYYGGFFKMFPARITAPHTGNWNVVIDLGGGRANIRYSLTVSR